MRNVSDGRSIARILSRFLKGGLVFLACLGFLVSFVAPVRADNWHASMYDAGLPVRVVAVDKAQQKFHLYEKKSPLTLKLTYPCTTGQVEGDKQVINDLRTPEGVYFVEYKIANGLDFKEYGGIAYTLNYPNPVDRLRGKTGHGIWIHSKGFGIVPRDTRGCIAIGLDEIQAVGPLLTPGTAVVVAERIPTERIPQRDGGTARHLRMRMDQWTRAWAARSAKLFDFYDGEAYSKAMPETFSAFRANKERLFKRFDWINIFNREVHVMEGPGYWVTWSEQFYRAPNLSTEGIRRLYWQQSKDKQFRIVGMEWLPRDLGMQTAFRKGQLTAALETPVSDASSEAPVPPPLSMPEVAEESAAVPAPVVSAAPAPQMYVTPRPQQDPDIAAPATPHVGELAQAPSPQSSSSTIAVAAAPQGTPAAVEPQTAPTTSAAAAEAAPALDAAVTRQLRQRMEQWGEAWRQRSTAIFDLYDQQRYGTLKDIPHRDSFRALKTDITRRFRAPWLELLQRPVRVSTEGRYLVTSAEQWLREPRRTPVEGTRHFYWLPDAQGMLRIVASRWEAGQHGMQADYLEAVAASVANMVESWRAAWQAGDVDGYMAFYASNGRQQGRGPASIREHKARLWAAGAPQQVAFTGLRVQIAPAGVRVDMMQSYRDSTGRGDRGIKTLLLQPEGGSWRILEESWVAEPLAAPTTPAGRAASPVQGQQP